MSGLIVAYEAITGLTVWPSMKGLLVVCRRIHGPDTMKLMQELYEDGGAKDLLRRLREYPPRETVPPLPTEEAEAEAEAGEQQPKDFMFGVVDEALRSAAPVRGRTGEQGSGGTER